MTCVRIHQVSTSATCLCTMCAAGRPGASDYPLPDQSDMAMKNYEPPVHLRIDINRITHLSILILQMNLTVTSTSSLRLQCTLVIPSQYPP